jgi:CheY-like chemotaxis protein
MPAEGESIAGARILVIEDNEDLREVFALCLENAGAHVRTAEGGNEALDLLSSWIPDVVFCDLHMPVMDGWEFVKQMRQRRSLKRVPTIAVTGASSDQALIKAHGGFQGHVLKPVTAAMLAKHVNDAMKGARRSRPDIPM